MLASKAHTHMCKMSQVAGRGVITNSSLSSSLIAIRHIPAANTVAPCLCGLGGGALGANPRSDDQFQFKLVWSVKVFLQDSCPDCGCIVQTVI